MTRFGRYVEVWRDQLQYQRSLSASKPFKPDGKIPQTHGRKILRERSRFLKFCNKVATKDSKSNSFHSERKIGATIA